MEAGGRGIASSKMDEFIPKGLGFQCLKIES